MPSPRTPKPHLPSRFARICSFASQAWVSDARQRRSFPMFYSLLGDPLEALGSPKHPRQALFGRPVGKRGQNDQAGKAADKHTVQRSESSTPAACRQRLQVGDELGHDLCCCLWLSGEPNALSGPL